MTHGRNLAALDALRAQLDLYSRILDLTREQREAIESENTDRLLALLAEKGRLTNEVSLLGQSTNDTRGEWASITANLGTEATECFRNLVAEIAARLRSIIEEEDKCQRALGNVRNDKAEELIRVQKGRSVAKAYGQGGGPAPRFRDEQK